MPKEWLKLTETGIVLDYNPFVRESKIYIVRDGEQEFSQIVSNKDDIINTIIDLAYENNIYNVFISAPNFIANGFSQDINEYERNQYSYNRIKIEVI